MICFSLRCDRSHGFEGWFRSGEEFDRQSENGMLSCPECGSTSVAKALMAPSVAASDGRSGAPTLR